MLRIVRRVELRAAASVDRGVAAAAAAGVFDEQALGARAADADPRRNREESPPHDKSSPNRDPARKAQMRKVATVLAYVRSNSADIRLMIGRGLVEAACKTLVARR